MAAPVDALQREQALDPSRSFIVQAPAGSGKTELLTRRVLTLLTTVERPEEVLAITFTRKAEAEMRHRVVASLKRAADPSPAADDYEAEGLALARRVLERDASRGWNLVADPSRLGLRTIDSFSAQLARRLPVSSQLGAPVNTVDDASALYRIAAERFLDHEIASVAGLSQQLDNNLAKLRDSLVTLLGIRDQWGRLLADDFSDQRVRSVLESMLAQLLRSRLHVLRTACPPGLMASLAPIVQRAANYLTTMDQLSMQALGDSQHNIVQLAEAVQDLGGRLPSSDVDTLNTWALLGDFLLTVSDGNLRKTVRVSEGFPAKGVSKKLGVDPKELASHKNDMLELLESLRAESAFLELLKEARSLPAPVYQDDEWKLIGQLGQGLPRLLAELKVVFAERGEMDFVEIGSRALHALGDEDNPTDLALAIDLRIKHILVDEFQDTSLTQYALFERLVAGWQEGDGRTFFAVGDPMQSIYRFREGKVGLFLKAMDEGIGAVPLDALQLSVNFRSAPAVIDWVNAQFSEAFPKRQDRDIGAVTYEPSTAHRDEAGQVDVHILDPAVSEDAVLAEAEHVVSLVNAARHEGSQSIGILVRGRSHVPELVRVLQREGVAFRAVELETLGKRGVVRDLVALVLALRYPHDRSSWLSVLRSALCGLSLKDLHALVHDSHKASVPDLIRSDERLQRLSSDGQARLSRFVEEVMPALERAPRSRLMPWVEALWLRLGGPAMCRDDVDEDAAERALLRLAELEQRHGLWNRADIETAMKKLYAAGKTDEESNRVQIMTWHKSKGLEFDTVILPSLGRGSGRNDARLLDWYESSVAGRPNLVLAPIDRVGDRRKSAIGRLLKRFRDMADSAEHVRLLYVACTRARRRLHLVATLAANAQGQVKPRAQSSVSPIWPSLAKDHALPREPRSTDDASAAGNDGPDDVLPSRQVLQRTRRDWVLPTLSTFSWQRPLPEKREAPALTYDWQGTTARDVGTVVHRELQRLAERPEPVPDRLGDDALARIRAELRTLAVTEADIDRATQQVLRAVHNTLADERGRWTLAPHNDARSEWALSIPTIADGRVVDVQRVVIDRSFVDEEGTRWIVDYKTGSHEGGGLDDFLDRELERYSHQLDGYAAVMQTIEPERPLRLGLWFPMVSSWREYRRDDLQV